jgi:hypothetical protein
MGVVEPQAVFPGDGQFRNPLALLAQVAVAMEAVEDTLATDILLQEAVLVVILALV